MEERISIRAEKAQRSPIPRGSYFRSVCTIFSLTNTDVDVRHIRTSADDRRLNSSMVQRELRRGIWNAKTFVYLFLKLMKFDVSLYRNQEATFSIASSTPFSKSVKTKLSKDCLHSSAVGLFSWVKIDFGCPTFGFLAKVHLPG